jgi:hypothetical protein
MVYKVGKAPGNASGPPIRPPAIARSDVGSSRPPARRIGVTHAGTAAAGQASGRFWHSRQYCRKWPAKPSDMARMMPTGSACNGPLRLVISAYLSSVQPLGVLMSEYWERVEQRWAASMEAARTGRIDDSAQLRRQRMTFFPLPSVPIAVTGVRGAGKSVIYDALAGRIGKSYVPAGRSEHMDRFRGEDRAAP